MDGCKAASKLFVLGTEKQTVIIISCQIFQIWAEDLKKKKKPLNSVAAGSRISLFFLITPKIIHPFKVMPYKGKRHSNKSCVTHWACTQDTLVALSGGEQVMFGEGLSLLINTSIIPAGSDRSPQTCRDPGSICGWHITQAGCHKHEGRGLCHSSLNKPTWAFRAALLRLRHRVFTGQNRTLDGVTFHMAWLRDHRHKVHRRQSAVLKTLHTTYHLWKRFKNHSYTVHDWQNYIW